MAFRYWLNFDQDVDSPAKCVAPAPPRQPKTPVRQRRVVQASTAFATALKFAQLNKQTIRVSHDRYRKKLAPSMLRNWNAMLMQTPISERDHQQDDRAGIACHGPNWDQPHRQSASAVRPSS